MAQTFLWNGSVSFFGAVEQALVNGLPRGREAGGAVWVASFQQLRKLQVLLRFGGWGRPGWRMQGREKSLPGTKGGAYAGVENPMRMLLAKQAFRIFNSLARSIVSWLGFRSDAGGRNPSQEKPLWNSLSYK